RVTSPVYLVLVGGWGYDDGQRLYLELHPDGEGEGVVGAPLQRALANFIEADVRTGITGEGAGEGVRAHQGRREAVGQRRVNGAVDLVLAGGGRDGEGQLLDLKLHPGREDERVVGAQGERALGDVVQAHVRTGIAGEGAGERVRAHQGRREAVGQRRVARAVDLILAGVGGGGDGQLLDLELHPAAEDQGEVGAQGQRPLGDVVQADVRAVVRREGAGEGVSALHGVCEGVG